MTVGELFINLGIKGADTAVKSLDNVNKGVKDVGSSSLAAKAALVGLVYAVERFTTNAGERGMELKQFADYTGLSADQLQRWQYAARQSGVAAEEITGNIKSVQTAMTDMILNGKPPSGIGTLAATVGFDRTRARDTMYVMSKLREFAQATKNTPDLANNVLGSFGLSPATIQFLRNSRVELDKIKPSNIFGSNEIAALARVDVAWKNLANSFSMFMSRLVAKEGLNAISALQNSFNFITDLTRNIDKLMQQIPAFKTLMVGTGLAISVAFAPILTAVGGMIYLLSEFQKHREGREGLFSGKGVVADFFKDLTGPNARDKEVFAREMLRIPIGPLSPQQMRDNNLTIQQYNYGVKDSKESLGDLSNGVQRAYRQMKAQAEGN